MPLVPYGWVDTCRHPVQALPVYYVFWIPLNSARHIIKTSQGIVLLPMQNYSSGSVIHKCIWNHTVEEKKYICINFSDISYILHSVNSMWSKKKKNHYLCGCICEVLCHPQYVVLRQPIYNPLHTSILLFIFKNAGGGSKMVFYLIYPLLYNLRGFSETLCVLKLRLIHILYTGYLNIWTIRESLKSKFNSHAN